MQTVLATVFPVFALIALGFGAARVNILAPQSTDVLNRYVIYLALPAMLFRAMVQTDWAMLGNGPYILSFGGGMIATFALMMLFSMRSRASLADRAVNALAASYPNTGYMGLPLALMAFGAPSLPAAAVAMLMTTCIIFGIAIVFIEMDRAATPNLVHALAKVAWGLLKNPLMLSPVLGAAYSASGIGLPVAIDRFLELLGASASPCALVTIGLFLAERQTAVPHGGVWSVVLLKLFVQPAVTGFLAFRVFELPHIWASTALLLSALPIGTGPFMLAKYYRLDAGVTSRAILLTTLGSVITTSLLVAWLVP
ncbi:MAG: AEC family transporter [Chelatococcus sp.]|uniref:AEC family transporter n=1 Tax=unclassified Chelatococcus TaxID=2638111 RepID=UPI001BCFCDE8|nr:MULTISPECIES: AEC family transporter [unclassified Chelatococcus]CAH1656592.1 conserved membrane hypothetical protein [Hyphomicrobiales bacterium]MBS7740558.1 AEC family transporter [Chelatococcus sp. HY11]MBX3538875.1 AEC family transporter [Chelatococcus sp.]MBX3544658.1 AEC family transporter [Chelatococcus sp.]MCO5078199.1 AEC family transporter [Chelatococcus sp.]